MAKDPSAGATAGARRGEPSGLPSTALTGALLGARAGDPDAIDAWFRSEHPAVYRLCFGFLADAARAEDLATDAMLHLFDELPGWDPARSYPAWRDAVVLNLCRDRRRRDEARGRAHRGAWQRESERARRAAPAPLAELEREETSRILVETLAALTPREREVFVLRDLEQRTTEETARCLGVAPGTVRSMLTLARRRLRGLLERRLGDALFDEAWGGEHV